MAGAFYKTKTVTFNWILQDIKTHQLSVMKRPKPNNKKQTGL